MWRSCRNGMRNGRKLVSMGNSPLPRVGRKIPQVPYLLPWYLQSCEHSLTAEWLRNLVYVMTKWLSITCSCLDKGYFVILAQQMEFAQRKRFSIPSDPWIEYGYSRAVFSQMLNPVLQPKPSISASTEHNQSSHPLEIQWQCNSNWLPENQKLKLCSPLPLALKTSKQQICYQKREKEGTKGPDSSKVWQRGGPVAHSNLNKPAGMLRQ